MAVADVALRPLAPLRRFPSQVIAQLRAAREDLTGAAAARLATLLVLHPLDVTKVRLQVTTAQSDAAVRAATQGPWFSGVVAAAAGHVPYGVLTFGLFAALKARLDRRDVRRPRVAVLSAALAADLMGALWLVPMETVKLRVQAGVHSSIGHAFRVGGLYNGFLSQVLRDAPFRALHIIGYDAARTAWRKRVKREITGREGIAIGAAVGAVVGAITTPMDVVKTRVMSQRVGPGRAYAGWGTCLKRTVKTEGSAALFRGLVPRTVYMAASVALFSVAYEAGRRFVKEGDVADKVSRKMSGNP